MHYTATLKDTNASSPKLSRMIHKSSHQHGMGRKNVVLRGRVTCFQMFICTESIMNSLNFNELTQYMCSAQDRCDQLQSERVAFNGNGGMDGPNPIFLTQERGGRTRKGLNMTNKLADFTHESKYDRSNGKGRLVFHVCIPFL